MSRRNCGISVLIAIVGGIYISFGFLNSYEKALSLNQFVLMLSGATEWGPFSCESITSIFHYYLELFPVFVFEIFAGTVIYEDYCTASVYVFSREYNRKKWYVKKIISLLAMVLCFQLTITATELWITTIDTTIVFSTEGFFLLIYHVFCQFLWISGCSVLLNVCCCLWDSSIAYTTVMGCQIILFTLLGNSVTNRGQLVFLNPAAWTILSWQDQIQKNVYDIIELEGSYTLCCQTSLLKLIALTFFVIIAVGYRMINADILIEKR